jgi:photosystem II stability/assembly factor-like uncharacterized protein
LIALASDRIAYISLDLGDHWAKVPNSPPVAAPASLWVDPYDSARMAVNTHPQVGFITADGGQTGWVPSVASIEQSRRAEQAGMIEMHAYEFGRDHVIWGREGYSLYRSEDDGQRFKVCSQIRLGTQHYSSTGCEATFANWVAVDPAGRVFHSDQDCGLALSDDQMQSWHCLRYAVNEGNQSDHPSMRGKSVWNTDSTAGMIFDQGYTYAWITGRTIMQSELERFEYIWNADVVGSTLKERHNIYRSTDGELFEFWSYYNAFPWQWNSLSGNLIMDPVSPQAARTFYLAVPSGIWKSTDGAKRWTEVSPPRKGALPAYTNRYNWNRQPSLFAHVRIDPTESKRLFATTVKRVNPPVTSTSALSAIYVSQDRALSWKTVVSPIRSCWALEIAANGWVWAADRDSGLYLSRDSGGTWEHKLSLAFITSIVPLGDAVYVASDAGYRTMPDAGVYRSSSNGATWEEITHDLPHLRIMSMSTDGQRIFVGTRGAGAFVLNP